MTTNITTNSEKDVYRTCLGSIELNLRADGQLELLHHSVKQQDLIAALDAWNPDYENTNVVSSAVRIMDDLGNLLDDEVKKQLNSVR